MASLRIERDGVERGSATTATRTRRAGKRLTWPFVALAFVLLAALGGWMALGRAAKVEVAYATVATSAQAGPMPVLSGSGYVVTGGTEPGALLQLATSDARVDAAIFDAGWLTPQMSAERIEAIFAERSVPSAVLQGDAKRSRAAVDRLLRVT